jgi:hypothetical protein
MQYLQNERLAPFRLLLITVWGLLAFSAIGCAPAPAVPGDDATPLRIPLTISRNPYFGTYAAKIAIALGNGKPLAFGFDTGSSGLHVFADARLDAPDAGVHCSHIPASVTYGNPARITFRGVVCYAQLHFEGFTTPARVPIAYLTSASCPPTNPNCKIPNLHSPKAMHGYGVFGAGLTGIMYGAGNVPNPILTLPGRRGSAYSVILTRDGGELVLGSEEPQNSAEFHLTPGTLPGEKYSLPRTCLFVDGHRIDACMFISFDTGNGVPWVHSMNTDSIPQQEGLVTPGTRLGFGPPGDLKAATSVIAGKSFADEIKVVSIHGRPPLTNASIQAFFDRIVTYDNTRGIIGVAHVAAPR